MFVFTPTHTCRGVRICDSLLSMGFLIGMCTGAKPNKIWQEIRRQRVAF